MNNLMPSSNPTEGSTLKRYDALVVAVLPEYRRAFLDVVREQRSSTELILRAGDIHLVATVETAKFNDIQIVPNFAILGRRLLWQRRALRGVLGARTAIVDLNPRSLTAWTILLARKMLRRRTIVWGHLFPRAGAESSTARIRETMRRLADGVLCYTWSDRDRLQSLAPLTASWVAANALYRADEIRVAWPIEKKPRTDFLCVGRLVGEKKVGLLIEAFRLLVESHTIDHSWRLLIVGEGPEQSILRHQVSDSGLSGRVVFLGQVSDRDELFSLYAGAICGVSPGSAGLTLTQSLGFGVPMLVSRQEPHGPEIELLTDQTGCYFSTDNPQSLADNMLKFANTIPIWDERRESMSAFVRSHYSAEVMAYGLISALDGAPNV